MHVLLHLGSPFLEVQHAVLVDVAFIDNVLNVGNLLSFDVQSLQHLECTLHNNSIQCRVYWRLVAQ